MEYFAIDFETANQYSNSACSIGVVRFVDGEEKDSVYSLIKPAKMYFRPDFIDIHHISYDDVRDKPYFPEVWQTIIEPFLGKSENKQINFVAHNARFDMGVIKGCCEYFGMPLLQANYACTLQAARKAWSELDCHRLTFLADHFGIEYDAHNALDDARTCGKIFSMAAEKLNCSCEDLFFKQGFCKVLGEVESSSVGIFWFYNGSPVFVHAVPVKEGLRYDKAITGIKDHADYWEELKSTGQLGILPENLMEEYFSIPRGRVVYHEDRDFFTLYHGNNLTKRDLQKVAAAFCLPNEKTRFEKDIHYCDLQDDEWEQMFV